MSLNVVVTEEMKKWLIASREKLDLTQGEVSKRLGYKSTSNLAHHERGRGMAKRCWEKYVAFYEPLTKIAPPPVGSRGDVGEVKLSKRVKAFCNKADMSLRGFAKEVGIGYSTLQNAMKEGREATPSYARIVEYIARVEALPAALVKDGALPPSAPKKTLRFRSVSVSAPAPSALEDYSDEALDLVLIRTIQRVQTRRAAKK